MKRCPQCNRVESDEAVKFCRVDGAVLVSDSTSNLSSNEYSETQVLPAARTTEATPTAILTRESSSKTSEIERTSPKAADKSQPRSAPPRSNSFGRYKLVVLLAVLIVIIGGISLGFYLRARNSEVAIDSIAVLPFENRSGDADTDYLSDGLAESLNYRLSQLPNLKVSPTSTVLRYKGQLIDPVKVGAQLGVSAVLSGRIIQRGDNLTISAELVDVRYNKLLWGEQYQRPLSELLQTQREIAREIVDKLRLRVSGEETGLAKHYTENNEAYQLYLRGRFYWNKRSPEGLAKSLSYYTQAIEKDPNFALAYAGLADTYDLLGGPEAGGDMPPNEVLPKAKTAALKALELDESLAEPHASLAHVKFFYDRDFAGAEREYRRSIELNPKYALAHHWYAIYLNTLGRQQEALSEMNKAVELDPFSLAANSWLGRILVSAGQPDQAIEQLRKTIEMDPNFVLAHQRLGTIYEDKGMYDDAISEFNLVLKLTNGGALGVGSLAHAYALAGQRAEAQKSLDQLLEMSKQRYVSPTLIAMVYIALGEKDKAFTWLAEGDKAHDLYIMRLKIDSRFDRLRSDPRFTELVRRVGLAE